MDKKSESDHDAPQRDFFFRRGEGFIELFGLPYRNKVVSWFERARAEA